MTINGQQVECVDKFKYLGVLISNTLKWDEQFSCVLTKLQRLHFLFKKSHYYFEKKSMLLFVNGLFLSVIDYCLPIWGCVGTQFLTKTDKLLERILQTIFNGEGLQDFHSLLERANMLATSERMFFQSLNFIFKHVILESPLSTELRQLYEHKQGRSSLRSGNDFQVPNYTNLGRQSMHYRTCKDWNSLPLDVKACNKALIFYLKIRSVIIKKRCDIYVT